MNISKFQYDLPKDLIAQKPINPRNHSKLLVVDRKTGNITSKHFYNLTDILSKNDVLVLNKTKVFPARLYGRKETGGKVEILLVKNVGKNTWECLTKPGLKNNSKIEFGLFSGIKISQTCETSRVKFSINNTNLILFIDKIGYTPIPPYIHLKQNEKYLREKYQTVYAKKIGSIAAPTAGFHFTKKMLKELKNKGVKIEYLTLHVGLGTFEPVRTTKLENHKMHSEFFEINEKTANRLNKYKKEQRRIIAVGTTTTRALESSFEKDKILPIKRNTSLFIYPPYKLKFVDSIITNFHLPQTTLLALVSAFVSYPNTTEKFVDFNSSLIGKAYKKAIEERFRFYSFGDSSIIL